MVLESFLVSVRKHTRDITYNQEKYGWINLKKEED